MCSEQSSNDALADAEALERERSFYKQQEGEGKARIRPNRGAAEVPTQRECHQYRWFQTNELISVEVPLYRACKAEDLIFVLSEGGMQMSIRSDPTFAPLAGEFPGKVDTRASTYSLHSDGGGDHYLALVLRKLALPGTSELWYCLLEGEAPAPTVRFRGATRLYAWTQRPRVFDVAFRVPPRTTAAATRVDFGEDGGGGGGSGGGARVSLSVEGCPELTGFERRFQGAIDAADCFWMLDEDGKGGKELSIQVAKRPSGAGVQWWGGLFEHEDGWGQ